MSQRRDLYEDPPPNHEWLWMVSGDAVRRTLVGPVRKDGKRKMVDRYQYAYHGKWSPSTGSLYAAARFYSTELDAQRELVRLLLRRVEHRRSTLEEMERDAQTASARLVELEKESAA